MDDTRKRALVAGWVRRCVANLIADDFGDPFKDNHDQLPEGLKNEDDLDKLWLKEIQKFHDQLEFEATHLYLAYKE